MVGSLCSTALLRFRKSPLICDTIAKPKAGALTEGGQASDRMLCVMLEIFQCYHCRSATVTPLLHATRLTAHG